MSTRHFDGTVCRPSPWMLVGQVVGAVTLLVVSLAEAGHPPRSHGSAKTGAVVVPKPARTVVGRVVDVRRMSREVTIRSREGTLEHVVVPREAVVTAPHGERGLSGIRSGMTVRIVGGAGSPRLLAHRVVAHSEAGADAEGRPARHRVAH